MRDVDDALRRTIAAALRNSHGWDSDIFFQIMREFFDDSEMSNLNHTLAALIDRPEEDMKSDPVNHPSHYETNGIECFDAMRASLGDEAVKSFCVCNAFKYIWRYKHKNGLEDLKKAQWYLNKRLELEAEQEELDKTCRMSYCKELSGDEIYPNHAYHCSACDNVILEWSPALFQYCPACGAKVIKVIREAKDCE